MEQLYYLIAIVKENWAIIGTLAVVFFGLTNWVVKIHQIRKFRLEIHFLKKKLREKDSSLIEIATLDEISKYADKNIDIKKVRKFIDMKMEELIEESKLNESDYEGIREISLALTNIEDSNFPFFVQTIPIVIFVWLMPLAVGEIVKWARFSNSVFAQILNLVLEVIIVLVVALAVIFYTYQFIEFLYNKINSEE